MARRDEGDYSVDLLPPLLVRIIEAAAARPDDSSPRKGHAAALAILGYWALKRVPARGVLAPDADVDYRAIEDVAGRYLRFRVAARALREVLAVAKTGGVVAKVDEIDTAATWVRSISDNAYYYAGLATGVVFAEFAARREGSRDDVQ
jgi:hypothetical protein